MDATAERKQSLYHSYRTIWNAPGETIRRIAQTDPGFGVEVLAALYIIVLSGSVLRLQTARVVRDQIVEIIAGLILLVLVFRWLLYMHSAFLYWIGRAMGGKARYFQVLSAAGWSLAPGLPLGLLFFAFRLLPAGTIPPVVRWGILPGMVTWQAIILVRGMMIVENFSLRKALLSVVLAALVLLVAAGLCLAAAQGR